MSNDLGEALATIGGMILAGYILLKLSEGLDNPTAGNLESWGMLLIIIAVIGGILIIWGVVSSVTR